VSPQIASPLVGFNNNVRYHGMSFHIQTEDSGLVRPHIITHLFADGGRVIKTLRVDYSEHVGRPDCRATVQRMMRDQHKAMAYDLRQGRIDAIIDTLLLRAPPQHAAGPSRPPARLPRQGSAQHEIAAALPAALPVPPPAAALGGRARPPRHGVFSAVPSSSLDEIILRYVARAAR
jgi:hypothetical protein